MNLKYFKNFGVFFCSTKLDAVICTSLYLLLGVKMGGGLLIVSITRGIDLH